MPPTDKTACDKCSFRKEVLARIDGLNETVGAKLDGIKTEISSGFTDIRTNIDKLEQAQYNSQEKITKNAVNIGINSQSISSFKWVIGILITLNIANLAYLIKIATNH